MSSFSVDVVELIHDTEDHPNADRLSIIKIKGYVAISAKNEDGSHRYLKGDLIVYTPEDAIVPEYLLRQGFWDSEKNKGILSGSRGNKVKCVKLRGIFSQGIIFPVVDGKITNERGEILSVKDGDNVAEFLGVTKYEPKVPVTMSGAAIGLGVNGPAKYDFDSIQKHPDLFEEGMEVEANEKIHGTNFQAFYNTELQNPELFFDGNLGVISKGLGAQGLSFKLTDDNSNNLYVKALMKLLSEGFGEKIRDLSLEYNAPVRIWGEVYGLGVQDLHYGTKEPTFKAFDIKIGNNFLPRRNEFYSIAERLGLPTVPVLYRGPYNLAELIKVRDGKDHSNSHVREGIVIRDVDESYHPYHGRRIGKWVSPNYLTRKGDVTEYQ